jgi:transposase
MGKMMAPPLSQGTVTMLSAETQAEILARYYSRHEKVRRIAKDLGINRRSVQRVIARRSVSLERSSTGRRTILDDFKEHAAALLKEDPSIQGTVIFQRLRDVHGYTGGYTVVKEWVRDARALVTGGRSCRDAFLTIRFDPGDVAQVDWGEFGDVFGDGTKIHCFVMVLCYSRLIYIEFTRSEKFEDFLRCHERALAHFDGAVEHFWYDNLPSAVTERMGRLVRFNARFLAYLGHHGISPHACNVGAANEKGRVENGVKYVRYNFWPGRSFVNFDDLRHQSVSWMNGIANMREHAATKRVPRLVFDAEERNKLKPCNPARYDTDEVFTWQVGPMFRLTYQTNQYSVPWTFVGQTLTVRVSDSHVRMYFHDRQIASHARLYTRNGQSCPPLHDEGLREMKSGGATSGAWQVATLRSYGDSVGRYLDCLRGGTRSLRYEVNKLLALGAVYGTKALNDMISNFLERGLIGADQVELAMKRSGQVAVNPAPMAFADQRLAQIPSEVSLLRYDAFLFQGDTPSDVPADGQYKSNGGTLTDERCTQNATDTDR